MNTVAANTIPKPNSIGRQDNMRFVVLMCILLFALILVRAVAQVGFYLLAAVSLVVFMCSNVSHCFALLLFLIPFASIMKIGTGSMSFFTALYFLSILKMLFAKRYIRTNVLLGVMAFAAYNLVFSGFDQLTTIITMSAGLLMVYCLRWVDIKANTCIVAFTLGIVGASLLALLYEQLPLIGEFIRDNKIKLGTDNYAARFAGLQGNPNFYTLDIIVTLAVIVVMMYCKKESRFYGVFLACLSAFGLMSVSKSFLLSWLLLMVMWLILSIKQGVGQFAKFLTIAVIAGAAVYFVAYDVINTYLFRIESDAGNSLDGVFSGRVVIWQAYIQSFLSDMKILLLGSGLNAMEGARSAHNTFFESLYMLGLLGISLFLAILKLCMGKVVTRPVLWVPILMLLFRMLAISMLTYDNIWLYFGLLVVLSKEITEKANGEDRAAKLKNGIVGCAATANATALVEKAI